MTWQEQARAAARAHQEREQEAAEARAARTVEYVEKLRDRLGVRPTAGTARLGEPAPQVVHDEVRLRLANERDSRDHTIELRATVTDGALPVVHAWLQPAGVANWYDRGPVETLADLGLALDPTWEPDPTKPVEPEASVGDQLLTIVQALVRDVVHDVLDGTLGDGPP